MPPTDCLPQAPSTPSRSTPGPARGPHPVRRGRDPANGWWEHMWRLGLSPGDLEAIVPQRRPYPTTPPGSMYRPLASRPPPACRCSSTWSSGAAQFAPPGRGTNRAGHHQPRALEGAGFDAAEVLVPSFPVRGLGAVQPQCRTLRTGFWRGLATSGAGCWQPTCGPWTTRRWRRRSGYKGLVVLTGLAGTPGARRPRSRPALLGVADLLDGPAAAGPAPSTSRPAGAGPAADGGSAGSSSSQACRENHAHRSWHRCGGGAGA